MNRVTAYREKLPCVKRFRLFYSIVCLLCLLTSVQSELESEPISVKSTPQSNHPSYQDPSEHADIVMHPAPHNGDAPVQIQTNDVPSDTSHSQHEQSEQKSLPSENSDESANSSSNSETNSHDDKRELDKNSDTNLQEGEVIHTTPHQASLGEDAPEEKLNDESKGLGEGDGEMNERGSSKVHGEGGSVNQADAAEEIREKGSDMQQQTGQEVVTEHSIDEPANGNRVGEGSELKQEAGVSDQATPEGEESTQSVEDGGDVHEETGKEMETKPPDRVEDGKLAENLSESEKSHPQNVPKVMDSAKEEESEGVTSRGEGETGGREEAEPVGEEEGRREEDGEGDKDGSSDDEMMTFEEFKQKKREEALLSGGGGLEVQLPPVGVANPKSKNNYASVDCGAKVIRHNPEAKNSQDILTENKDAYMINPCSATIWFIVELCELVSVRSLEIASFELFSSTPQSFKIYASERFEEGATVDWVDLGTFHAVDERRVQQFPLETHVYAKYIKVDMLSHYGDEHYCPLSLLHVLGASMMDIYEESQQVKEQPTTTQPSLVLTEGQDKDDFEDEDDPESQNVNKTLLRRAREAVLSMLEHPFRIVNEFIKKDDSETGKNGKFSEMEDGSHDKDSKSHDQASGTSPSSDAPSADSARDIPTLECAAGDLCNGEVVKIVKSTPNQDDLTSTTPMENTKNEQSESSFVNMDPQQAAELEVLEVLDVGGVESVSGMQGEERPADFKGEGPDGTPLQSIEPPLNAKSDDSTTTTAAEVSQQTSVTDTNDDTATDIDSLTSRGMSLGPTNITTKGASMDGGDVSQWNTGGAISAKDKVPPVISEGEEQTKAHTSAEGEDKNNEEADRGNSVDNMNSEDSVNLSLESDADNLIHISSDADEQRDKIVPTPTLLGPESIESAAVNDYDNEGRYPHTKDVVASTGDSSSKELPIGTESDQLTISPTPSQIAQHPEQAMPIQTTNTSDKEAVAGGSITHVASAASPMATNERHQANKTSGFDAVDVANGSQPETAGHKVKESGPQVATKDLPHGTTNESTSHVRLMGDVGSCNASIPTGSDANNAALPDAASNAGKGGGDGASGAQTGTAAAESLDRAISQETDSPSHQPAVQGKDIPTQTISTSTTKDSPTSEADVHTTADVRNDSNTVKGDRPKTQPESAVRGDENLDISQNDGDKISPTAETKPDSLGSHSLHVPSNRASVTVSYDEETNQNSGLGSLSSDGSKHEESNVDHSESERMIGMKSGEMGSRGDSRETTLMKNSSPSLSRSDTGDSESGIGHYDSQRNGMNGMPGMQDNSDVQSHTPVPPGPSPSMARSDDNSDGLSSDNTRHPASLVTDDLPKTTDGDSLNVSRASAVNCSKSPAAGTSHNASKNVSLTGNPVNASLSTQQSLTDTQPQANGSLTNQNAGLGAEELPASQSSQTQHRDDETNSNMQSVNAATPIQSQQQAQQGGTINQTQNSTIPPLTAVVGGGNGNGGGGGGGHGGLGGQVSAGRDREKSVFLRLSNQIQELETNMSLFSSYLDQISTSLKRNKNRTEETTKALDKKISSLNESLLTLSQALSELTSREVGVLRELHSELKSEAEELHNLTKKVDTVPNDVITKHLWLLVVQSGVVMAVFLISSLWLCRANRSLERKLNDIQTTLSSQSRPLPSKLTSIGLATDSAVRNQQQKQRSTEQNSNKELTRRTKSASSQSSTHARSLSFTSVADLHRQAENIGDLSRADLKARTTTRSTSWQESRYGSELTSSKRETAGVSDGPLASHSLTSLDERRAPDEVFSVYEGRKKRKHKSKKATG